MLIKAQRQDLFPTDRTKEHTAYQALLERSQRRQLQFTILVGCHIHRWIIIEIYLSRKISVDVKLGLIPVGITPDKLGSILVLLVPFIVDIVRRDNPPAFASRF